jgi:hypothetical protein
MKVEFALRHDVGATALPTKRSMDQMADLLFPWNIYAERQKQLMRATRVTDQTWGIENGLNALLTSIKDGSLTNQSDAQRDVDRAIATRFWKERNRARLRRKYIKVPAEFDAKPERHPAEFSPSPIENHIHARIRLARVHACVNAAEWKIIIGAAAGFDCKEIARVCGGSAGNVRAKLSRLRSRLRLAV